MIQSIPAFLRPLSIYRMSISPSKQTDKRHVSLKSDHSYTQTLNSNSKTQLIKTIFMTNCLKEVPFCHLPQSAFPKCVFRDINSTRCPVQCRKNSLVHQVRQMLHIMSPSRSSEYTTGCSENSGSQEKAFHLLNQNFPNLFGKEPVLCKIQVTHSGEMPHQTYCCSQTYSPFAPNAFFPSPCGVLRPPASLAVLDASPHFLSMHFETCYFDQWGNYCEIFILPSRIESH